jgi:hypothetical protein
MLYENVTIDLEALDTTTSSKILSIGVVPFNFGEQVSFEELCTRESSLYLKIDMSTYPDKFTESASTMAWWNKQGDEARHVLAPSSSDLDIVKALIKVQLHLMEFVQPLEKNGGQVFTRGYDFDGGILNHHFNTLLLCTPWTYNRFRCIRTAIDMLAGTRNGYVKEANPDGFIKHHALHDAAKDTLTLLTLREAMR